MKEQVELFGPPDLMSADEREALRRRGDPNYAQRVRNAKAGLGEARYELRRAKALVKQCERVVPRCVAELERVQRGECPSEYLALAAWIAEQPGDAGAGRADEADDVKMEVADVVLS